jgi:hypothetical protein
MAVQPRDPSKRESQPEKKKTETVHLSAEELRKIAGGASTPPIPPPKAHGPSKKP